MKHMDKVIVDFSVQLEVSSFDQEIQTDLQQVDETECRTHDEENVQEGHYQQHLGRDGEIGGVLVTVKQENGRTS